MAKHRPLNYVAAIPDILKALEQVHVVMDGTGFDRTVHHLVQLRASQINGCAFCVKMHTNEARQDGETNERLDRLVVWERVSDFTPKERAALAWTEALTSLERRTDYAALRAGLREHFTEVEVGVLTVTATMINLWNRLQIACH
ncbi:carboxymuconolactone decarboxylase family protein [Vulgatibacter sp.]|uniref:carboxymuconolactone decarboxylase family protein n=1 Tax=Vulgatibacter sp. TaxID=1971226 RepID=UPI003568FBA9